MNKKFSDFRNENSVNGKIIVGYDPQTGEEIRVSAELLKGQAGNAGTVVQVQFSNNGSSWHNTYNESDKYMRMKVGSDAWSSSIPLGSANISIDSMDEINNIETGQYIVVVTEDGLCKINLSDLKNALQISASVLQQIGLIGNQNEFNANYTTNETFVIGTTALYLNGQRLYRGSDYIEGNNGNSITFSYYYPKSNDRLMLEGIIG